MRHLIEQPTDVASGKRIYTAIATYVSDRVEVNISDGTRQLDAILLSGGSDGTTELDHLLYLSRHDGYLQGDILYVVREGRGPRLVIGFSEDMQATVEGQPLVSSVSEYKEGGIIRAVPVLHTVWEHQNGTEYTGIAWVPRYNRNGEESFFQKVRIKGCIGIAPGDLVMEAGITHIGKNITAMTSKNYVISPSGR
ncbi:MAG TPA: hypothetical protein VFF28_01980 [Candidatus Nanoarchaeia archaeon]|nr:hypothetical protein [Candidatus Nanoarchaeia archaeon]